MKITPRDFGRLYTTQTRIFEAEYRLRELAKSYPELEELAKTCKDLEDGVEEVLNKIRFENKQCT